MKDFKPFVHLFKTTGNNYLYDVNTNVIIKAKDHEYRYLEYILHKTSEHENVYFDLSEEEVRKAIDWIKNLQTQGFLSNKRGKKVRHYLDNYLEGILSSSMENLILQVTQACNLRCKYCTYSGDYINRPHGKLAMTEETAKKAIDYYIAHTSDSPDPAFGFYGGEPFLNFELIKILVPYIKHKMRGKNYSFHITTNGTLLTEEIVDFLVIHNIDLMISLDGPKEVHDLNRCFGSGKGSFDHVMENIEMARKIAPEYVSKKIMFSSVFTKEINFCSLSSFFADFEAIKEPYVLAASPNKFYLKEENKQAKVDHLIYDDDVNYETFKYYLSKLGRFPESKVSKLIKSWEEHDRAEMEEKRMEEVELADNYHPSGPCVPGSRRLFVNINGELFPCERVSESSSICSIGTLDSGIDIAKARKILNIGSLTENECLNCWASRFCLSCVASADNGKEFDKKLKISYCNNFIANADYKLKKYCTLKEFNISTEKQSNIIDFSIEENA
jgi:uncharacterized protein